MKTSIISGLSPSMWACFQVNSKWVSFSLPRRERPPGLSGNSKLKLPPPPLPLNWTPARTYAVKLKFRVSDLRNDSSSTGPLPSYCLPLSSVRTRVFRIVPESAFDSRDCILDSMAAIRSSYSFCICWFCCCIFSIWALSAETSLESEVCWAKRVGTVSNDNNVTKPYRKYVLGGSQLSFNISIQFRG